VESALLTGLGLAAPAGLNAYVPLLILALADRLSAAVTLERPYHFLSSNWGIAIVVLLLTVEVVVDKVPGLDHVNDLVQSAIRPAAGAVLAMAATSDVASLNPVVSLVLGLFAAGSVHAAKATARPAVTLATGGLGNPLVSLAEDAVAAIASVLAIFVPILAVALLLLLVAGGLWAHRRLRRRLAALPTVASDRLRR
jgi:hypothetical protein